MAIPRGVSDGRTTDPEDDVQADLEATVTELAHRPVPSLATRALDRLTAWDDAVRHRWPFRGLVPDPEPVRPGQAGRALVRPAILGFVAITAIVAGVSQPDSPFVLKQAGAWFFGVPSGSGPATTSSTDLFLGLVAVYGGLVLLMRAWFALARLTNRSAGVPVGRLALVLCAWVVPLLIAPPLFSRDVYSYAAQGQMMSHHISPYLYGPGALGPGSPYQQLVDPIWMNVPAPYGPLFLQVDGLLARLSFGHVLVTVMLLRMLALVGVALLAVGVPRLARAFGRDPGEAFVLAVLNPVTILHFAGGAHNDALMVGLLVLGLAVARRGRPMAGIVLCSLAAAVKAPGLLGVLYIGWGWMGEGVPVRERIRPVLSAGLVAVVIMAVLSFVTGLGWGWVGLLATPGTVTSWLAPATGVGIVLGHLTHLVHLGVSRGAILSFTRVLGELTAAVLGVVLLVRSERLGVLRAMGITALLVVVLGPVVQPWYLSWGLILLAPVATGKVRSVLFGLSVSSAFIGLPGGRQLLQALLHQLRSDPLVVAVGLLACLFILTVPLTPVRRRNAVVEPNAPADYVPAA